jgi:hypothetical protein
MGGWCVEGVTWGGGGVEKTWKVSIGELPQWQ